MLDDPVPRPAWRRVPATLVALAGLLGVAGVGVSAAAAHRGGGALATTAGLFCLLHAGAVIGIAALIAAMPGRSGLLGVAGFLLAGGAILFSGDLALAGLADWRPLAAAAPLGGGLLMAGWLVLVAGGLSGLLRHR